MFQRSLIRHHSGTLPLSAIKRQVYVPNEIAEASPLRWLTASAVDRGHNARQFGLRLGFGHSRNPPQLSRLALPVLPPSRDPNSTHLLQTTFLKPSTHVEISPSCVHRYRLLTMTLCYHRRRFHLSPSTASTRLVGPVFCAPSRSPAARQLRQLSQRSCCRRVLWSSAVRLRLPPPSISRLWSFVPA